MLKIITKIIMWFFSILFLLSGFTYLRESMAGVLFLLLGVLILPPFLNFLEKKNKKPSKFIRTILGVALFIIAVNLVPDTTIENIEKPSVEQSIEQSVEQSIVESDGTSEAAIEELAKNSVEVITIAPEPTEKPDTVNINTADAQEDTAKEDNSLDEDNILLNQKSSTAKIESTPTPTLIPTATPTPTPKAEVKQEDSKEVTVYITKTGSKYHRDGCQYLRKSKIAISLDDAKDEGYEPCSRCNPPE